MNPMAPDPHPALPIPAWPLSTERELELLKVVLDSSQWGGFHEFVPRFEQDFARFQGCSEGAALANGTVAIEAMLIAAGIGPGDEIIVPSISFISTATAVSRIGATPVFVDIEPRTFNMDPERAEAAVTERTRGIIAVHFGGPMANVDRLWDICRRHGLTLWEDAAHAQGSEWSGRRAGSVGHAGTFSFQNGKVMTAGEGGIVTTNDAEFASSLRSVVNQGRKPGHNFFFHFRLGTNFRITALQAAVLIAQLERLPEQIEHRRKVERVFKAALEGVDGLDFQEVPEQAALHSHYLLLGRIDAERFGMTRDEFCDWLNGQGVPCTPFYPHLLQENPVFQDLPHRAEPCPIARERLKDTFWLPHRVLMASEETLGELAGMIVQRTASTPRSSVYQR